MYLEIKKLEKVYKDKIAVKDFNIKLEAGIYGLLGANGAGKTTLMRILTGLIESTKGFVLYNGVDINKMGNQYCKNIGYLPQDFGYYPEFTVDDFLMYIAAVKGLDHTDARKRVNEVIDIFTLAEKKNKKIKTLSGGMKRRVGIAQAILNNPKILILDEPTTGLDPKERIKFRNFLSKFSDDKIVLLSTHIVSDVESIANKILIMKNGKLIDHGTFEELLERIEGCVWECNFNKKMADSFQMKYLVSNLKTVGEIATCRVVSKNKPTEEAFEIKANLEDLYTYYFNKDGEVE
ncbi:ABC-2 type transport system ATP-binding protein [Lachnotalea glycerini]|uniref:ABC-2 type transport system ATP-binding protein n=1 Tax=Lachnotalea glycerini TaxID=1763509 RepID=A0A318ETI4_9FIRM|nr:ABC transporter ATP-binding protein [Lachnotalea glycerini]PXV91558.1 ABC-2 type transport system ATP-binding protein [Lachnotalea glycerini]